tara:strand:- start:225 stop:611 length:387 start_codon:yes stop_codon:yes gene_type:complete
MYKIVKGTKFQKRPSASYFYNKLNQPIGFVIYYRPRKGGKMIKHSLQVRNLRGRDIPYWRAEEKLPTKKYSVKTRRSVKTRKTSRKKSSKRTQKRKPSRRSTLKRKSSRRSTLKRKSSRRNILRGGSQ